VAFSVYLCYVGAAIFIPSMIYMAGVWGLVKLWVAPWLIFHFWLSTFTLVHHTLPHIPFKPMETWHDAAARLSGTVHCEYGWLVERLCHHINVHVPHHVSTRIPSYNLRPAFESLRKNWGQYINEATFSLYLLKEVLSKCNLYHEEYNYTTFDRSNVPAGKTPKKHLPESAQ